MTMLWPLLTLLISTGFCFAQPASKDSGQNPGFPRVVARLNIRDATRAIGPQMLYIPSKAGVFRASGVMACTIGNGSEFNPAWTATLSWTNELGHHAPAAFLSVPAWEQID